jgi:hypothetical protein
MSSPVRRPHQLPHHHPPPTATPTSAPRAASKRKRTESPSAHQLTKQVRDTSPTPNLMHCQHEGQIFTSGLPQLPPTTSEPPRVDPVETEQAWKKLERKRWKGNREKKVRNHAAGVLTWVDIARQECEGQRLYWRGRWLHQAEGTPTAREEEEATRETETRFFFYSRAGGWVLSCLSFLFFSFCL